MKKIESKKGMVFINKDKTNGVNIGKVLYIPDNVNYLDLYEEVTEEEALELQEKYNTEDGNNYRNRWNT